MNQSLMNSWASYSSLDGTPIVLPRLHSIKSSSLFNKNFLMLVPLHLPSRQPFIQARWQEPSYLDRLFQRIKQEVKKVFMILIIRFKHFVKSSVNLEKRTEVNSWIIREIQLFGKNPFATHTQQKQTRKKSYFSFPKKQQPQQQ